MGSLRFLLALTVVFAHSPWEKGFVFVGGKNAVQLFYILSGFLICYVLNRNAAYDRTLTFYRSRALRIYPLFFVVAALSLLVDWLSYPPFFETYRQVPTSAAAMLAVSNAVLFGQDWLMFFGIKDGALHFFQDFTQSEVLLYKGLLVPQAWTLGLELCFYALAPFVLRSTRWMVGLFCVSLTIKCALLSQGLGFHDPWDYRFFPAELCFFMAGALSCRLLLPLWERVLREEGVGLLPHLATGGLGLLVVSYFVLPIHDDVKYLVLVAAFVALLPLAFRLQAASRFDRAIGELSYPMYVGHLLAILFVARLLPYLWFPAGKFAISLMNAAAAIGFAILLNVLIARRIERIRKPRGTVLSAA